MATSTYPTRRHLRRQPPCIPRSGHVHWARPPASAGNERVRCELHVQRCWAEEEARAGAASHLRAGAGVGHGHLRAQAAALGGRRRRERPSRSGRVWRSEQEGDRERVWRREQGEDRNDCGMELLFPNTGHGRTREQAGRKKIVSLFSCIYRRLSNTSHRAFLVLSSLCCFWTVYCTSAGTGSFL